VARQPFAKPKEEVVEDDTGAILLDKYQWGDEDKSVKIYINQDKNREAVAAAKEGKHNEVDADFKPTGFSLTIHGDAGKRFVLRCRGLFKEVVPEQCKFRVSAGKRVTVTLAKLEAVPWKVLSVKNW